jgi:hypothetical protein
MCVEVSSFEVAVMVLHPTPTLSAVVFVLAGRLHLAGPSLPVPCPVPTRCHRSSTTAAATNTTNTTTIARTASAAAAAAVTCYVFETR